MSISVEIGTETAAALAAYRRRYPECAESAVQDALVEFLTAERCYRKRAGTRATWTASTASKRPSPPVPDERPVAPPCRFCGQPGNVTRRPKMHEALCAKNPNRKGRWAK